MKKIVVNEDLCLKCGACVSCDSEHFNYGNEGFSTVISNENLDSEALQNAINYCPTSAISIVDEDSCSNNSPCECGENCQCGDNCECGDNCHCND